MENNRKDPRRQLIGAVSKALGQQFERDINAAFEHYRRLGVASIEKTPEPDRTAWSNPASAPARPSIWTKRCGSVLSAMFWPDFPTAVRTASHGASGAP